MVLFKEIKACGEKEEMFVSCFSKRKVREGLKGKKLDQERG